MTSSEKLLMALKYSLCKLPKPLFAAEPCNMINIAFELMDFFRYANMHISPEPKKNTFMRVESLSLSSGTLEIKIKNLTNLNGKKF